MVRCMKATGEMTFSTDMEKKAGLMGLSMKVNTWQVKNMEQACIVGMMDLSIKENGLKIKSKDLELTVGQMEGSFKESGQTITWMVWESTHGQMEDATWENIKMIKNMAMEFINGLMADYIQDSGCEESNMDQVYIKLPIQISNMDFGKKANVQNGLNNKSQKK